MVDKKTIKIITRSVEETQAVGELLGTLACAGEVIALIGDLGSGKTTLTQGIARGLGVPEEYYVTSPTFTLINEYPGRLPLYHFDVYRLSGAGDLEDMGYEEYFYGAGVVVIEWAEKLLDILPNRAFNIQLANISDETREMTLSSHPENYSNLKRVLEEGGYI